MDAKTRRRGSLDTAWPGHVLFALLSVLLHLLPVGVYLGSVLLGLPWFQNDAGELEDHPTIIPIEFGVDELGDVKPPTPPEPPVIKTATLEPPAPSSPPDKAEPAAPDAGVRDARPDAPEEDARAEAGKHASDAADAGVDAPEDAASLSVDAGQDATAQDDAAIAALTDASGPVALASDAAGAARNDASTDVGDAAGADAQTFEPIRDPIAVAGDARVVAQRNPNVSLLVFTARIRRHPLALRHSATLTSIQQWRVFFDGTNLDPVRDTDWMLLAGPQFRNTARVSVVLRYNVPEAKMRAAVNALMARSQPPGTWSEKSGVRFARLRVDGADRIVVMPQARILVIVPPDGLDQAIGLKSARFPGGEGDGTAVLLNLKTPRNAFRGLPADIPATIAWVKFSLKLTADGGADARVDAEDASEDAAKASAAKLTEQVDKLTVARFLFVERRLFDPIVFRADGKHIRAETHLSESQLSTILSMIGSEVDRINRRADAGAPP